jgi:hypothetical protein
MALKIGDLVRPRTKCDRGRNIGVVTQLRCGIYRDQIKVFWDRPVWYDPDDGQSVEYSEEMELLSKASRSV